MSILTQMSLVGFVASAPELHFTKAGAECCRMRVGIEQWRKEVDGSFTKLDPSGLRRAPMSNAAHATDAEAGWRERRRAA
jgi:Single-strand binding protein family